MKNVLSATALFVLAASPLTFAEVDKKENIVTEAIEDIKDLNESGLYKPHFALMGGVSDPVENGYESAEILAFEVGYQVMVPIGLGLEVSTQEFENDDEDKLTQTQLFVKGSYHFGGDIAVIEHSYVGLGLGLVQENSNEAATYGAIMPNIGFDIPLGDRLENVSLGANLRYTATASNEVDNFGLNGVVKYWF